MKIQSTSSKASKNGLMVEMHVADTDQATDASEFIKFRVLIENAEEDWDENTIQCEAMERVRHILADQVLKQL